MTLLLTNEEVAQVLDMPAALAALEPLYRDVVAGRAVLRPQTQTYLPGPLPGSSYCLKTVEGGSERLGTMALRVTSDVLRAETAGGVERRIKVPAAPGGQFLGLVLLFSTEHGGLLAILPDGVIQHLRVGATSALAAREMAPPAARTVGLLGAGGQAEAQLLALALVRPLASVRVYSPRPERREAFARRLQERLGIPVAPVSSARAAVEGVDIVAAATNSAGPVLDAAWLRPGQHVGFIREFEMSDAVLTRADRVVVHTRQGDIDHHTPRGQQGLARLQRGRGIAWDRYPELSEVLAGEAVGRAHADELTLFMNNFGIGIQFTALATRAYQRARERGLGRELPDAWFLETIQP
ncbi:MAG TPA: ornithine cyclodeaminase family protein [Chloroflexota bacterium]|jgi:alanine dehydrogenase|nr:ornithine cyclodeaminase family protein [Chloroflexota bacterium]